MKKLLYTLGLLILVTACSKEDMLTPEQQLAKDTEIIEEYIKANQLTAQKTASGLYYVITKEGTGDHPTINSKIKIKYKGYLVNKVVFDKTVGDEVLNDQLSKFIVGWQEGIPLFKKGGTGTLLIPSYLGYGSQSIGPIPKNSVLIFDIELVDFI